MSLADFDAEILTALADAGLGTYKDAVYTPPGVDAVPITGVLVAVEDLVSEATGEVTQGGAVLSLLKSQMGIAVQGATVVAGGDTWRITRRRSSTDPSMLEYEAHRI